MSSDKPDSASDLIDELEATIVRLEGERDNAIKQRNENARFFYARYDALKKEMWQNLLHQDELKAIIPDYLRRYDVSSEGYEKSVNPECGCGGGYEYDQRICDSCSSAYIELLEMENAGLRLGNKHLEDLLRKASNQYEELYRSAPREPMDPRT